MSVVDAHTLHRLRDAAKPYAPIITASFAGYILSSQQNLRVWIALQKTTTPSPNEVRKKSPSLIRLSIAAVSLGIPAYLAASGSVSKWGKLFLLPLLSYCTLILFTFLTGSLSTSVHRNADGGLKFSPCDAEITPDQLAVPLLEIRRSHPGSFWALIIPPLIVAFASLVSDNVIFIIVPLTALNFTVCRGHPRDKFVLSRWLITMIAIWFIMLEGVAIIWLALVAKYNIGFTPERKRKIAENLNNFDSISLYWSNWIAPSLLSVLLSPLFSSMLRFDYRNHCEIPSNPHEFENLAVVQPEKPSDGGFPSVGPGIVAPDHIPRNFAKPYFYATVSSWLLTQFVCVVMRAFIDSNFVVPRIIFSILSVPIALLGMIPSVMIVAVTRGEIRKLWRYTEMWAVSPTDPEAHGAAIEPVSNLEEESKEKSEQLI